MDISLKSLFLVSLVFGIVGCSSDPDNESDVPVTDLTTSNGATTAADSGSDGQSGGDTGNSADGSSSDSGGTDAGTDGENSGGGETDTGADGSSSDSGDTDAGADGSDADGGSTDSGTTTGDTDGGDTPPDDNPTSNELADYGNEQDLLTDAQRAFFPEDCLLAIHPVTAIAFCFSPTDRQLEARRADGSNYWSFTLPGTNDTNHIEGIEIVGGNTLVIVADTSTGPGQSGAEISVFHQSGAFQYTEEILRTTNLRADDLVINDWALNLAGEDLVVRSNGLDLFLAGNKYTLTPGGDSTESGDWNFDTAFIAKINISTGHFLAYRELDNASITSFALTADSMAQIDNDESTSSFSSSNLSNSPLNSSPSLNADNAPAIVPEIYEAFIGNFLTDTTMTTDAVITLLSINAPAPQVPCDIEQNNPDGSPCEYDISTAPYTQDCPISGTVTQTERVTTDFIPGSGRRNGSSITLEFNSCQVLVSYTEGLTNGTYQINGGMQTNQLAGGIRQGNQTIDQRVFTEFALTVPDVDIPVSLTGSDTFTGTFQAQAVETRELSFQNYSDSERQIDSLESTRETLSANGTSIDNVSLFGSVNYSSSTTAFNSMQFVIDPALANEYRTDEIPFSGMVLVTAASGDTVSLSASPESLGSRDLLDWRITNSNGSITAARPFDSLLIPYFD